MIFILSIAIVILAFLAWKGMRTRNQSAATISGIVCVLFALIGVSQFFTVVPAGHVGIVNFFGTVSEKSLNAGINMVNPLASVIKMSIQTQEIKEVMDVPSKEGLTVQLEVSVLYHLNPDKAADVYKTVGVSYERVILEPQFRSVTRGVTAGYEAKALYTSEREHLSLQIQKEIVAATEARGITIESKLQAEQESQRMQFVLTKERQEADRKRIEAQ
jgi:prohibitin 1